MFDEAGRYQPTSSSKGFYHQQAVRKLIHEQLHRKLNHHPNKDEILKRVEAIYNEFKAYIDNPSNNVPGKFRAYLFENARSSDVKFEEFLVESLTSNELVRLMNEISVADNAANTTDKSKKTLLDKIIELLNDLFGWSVKENSLREKELNLIRDLFEPPTAGTSTTTTTTTTTAETTTTKKRRGRPSLIIDSDGIMSSTVDEIDVFQGIKPDIVKEMKEIRAKAIADGTFMKAPNGMASKLSERQWLAVRTKEFKRWFGDWERLAEIELELAKINAESVVNSNNNSNFAQNEEYERRQLLSQRFSQEELSNGERITEEAEAILQRGENSSNPELQTEKTGDFQKGLKQEKELEDWAKEKGIWIDNTTESLTKAHGEPIAEGGESVVYDNGDKVIKEISLAYFIEPQLALDRIILHNSISDAQLTVTHFGRNENGEFVFVVEQPYVNGTQLTQNEIVEYMKSMGFAPYNNRNTEFSNGEILINDLHDENVIKRSDGSVTIIDADFRLNTANYGLDGKRTTQYSNNLESLQQEYEALKSQVSKVVDPDTKEPKALYHGSRINNLTEFDNTKAELTTMESAPGTTFFTDNEKEAINYTENVPAGTLFTGIGSMYECFLNIKNPYIIDFKFANWTGKGYKASYYSYLFEEFIEVDKTFASELDLIDYLREKRHVRGVIEEGRDYKITKFDLGYTTNTIAAEIQSNNEYDGVIIKNVKEISEYNTDYVIFNSNQAKSATDNNGEFSDDNSILSSSIIESQELAYQLVDHLVDTGIQVEAITQESVDRLLDDDVQAHIVGEKGAEALDKLEEATTRLDNLNVAREMEKAGKSARRIKLATGWEKGKDGKWRYEIRDLLIDKEYIIRMIKLSEEERKREPQCKLVDVLNHEHLDALIEAYPILKDIVIKPYSDDNSADSKGRRTRGYFDSYNKILMLNFAYPTNIFLPVKSIQSTTVLEIQHVIQNVEGFDKGGNTDMARSLPQAKEAMEKLKAIEAMLYDYATYSGSIDNDPLTKPLKEKMDSIIIEIYKIDRLINDSSTNEIDRSKLSEERIKLLYELATTKDIIREHVDEAIKKLEKEYELSEEQVNEIAFILYTNFAGEVEARNSQARMKIPFMLRRLLLLSDTEDVSREDQIILEDYLSNEGFSFSRSKKVGEKRNNPNEFHLSRNKYELSNAIFTKDSEKKYLAEIQSFIQSLPEDTDRTHGIWYVSKDRKRAFRINTSIENFVENKNITSFGFELADWYNLEKLNSERLKALEDGYKQNDVLFSSLLKEYEREQGSSYNSSSLLSNGETNWNNDGLDQETSSRESFGGSNLGDSRSNKGASGIEQQFFKTSKGELYGFVDSSGVMHLDFNKMTAEHPIHEYTHLWDRAVQQRNPALWSRGKELMKQIPLWQEILNDHNYGQHWIAQGITGEELDSRIASEVHARLTGVEGERILENLAKEKGSEGIIQKLINWLSEFWKELANTFLNTPNGMKSKLGERQWLCIRLLVEKSIKRVAA